MDKCTFMTVCDSSKVTIIKSDSTIGSKLSVSTARESLSRPDGVNNARERWRPRRRCCSTAAVSVEAEAEDDDDDVGERDGTTMMGEFAPRQHYWCWYRYYWFRCASWRRRRRRRGLVHRRISGTGSPVRCRHQSRRRRRRLCDGRTPRC